MAELEANSPWLKALTDRSSADFKVAKEWLDEHGANLIQSSSAKQYYDEIDSDVIDSVRDTFGVYSFPLDKNNKATGFEFFSTPALL